MLTLKTWLVPAYAHLAAAPKDFLLTAGLGIGLWLFSFVFSWWVSRKKTLETQRLWRLTVRNLAAIAFALGVGIIWHSQLQSAMVAIGAAAAGLLLAFREYFMSLLGFWFLMVKRTYTVGDFIEVEGARGEVIDIRWQCTVLAETGLGRNTQHYTGRRVQVPNHHIMLGKVYVDNITGEYGAHIIKIPVNPGVDILVAEQLLLNTATAACESFIEDARVHLDQMRRDHAIDTPSVQPKTLIWFDENGNTFLQARLVVPVREKQRIEQAILRTYLQEVGSVAPVWH